MFVFKLQQVLDYRINIEEKILHEFSEQKRCLALEEFRLKNLIEERINSIGELKKMRNVAVHSDDIALYVSYIERTRAEEEKQKKVIISLKERLENKRKELVEAVKRRKVMERLKEKHKEEFEKDMREMEQRNSDEMTVLRFGWREK